MDMKDQLMYTIYRGSGKIWCDVLVHTKYIINLSTVKGILKFKIK